MAAKLGADDKKFKMADSLRHVIIMYMTRPFDVIIMRFQCINLHFVLTNGAIRMIHSS